jgi:pyruvate formate lyase activating enzyme
MSSQNNISKREFLKCAALGACSLALAGTPVKLLAGGSKVPGGPTVPSGPEDPLWKWSKEALYYIDTPKGIKCKLCPQACEIKPEDVGDCRTNFSHNGKLYSITYGNPCAVHVDPVEKKPLFHFLPSTTAYSIATAGCNLACLNCQNWEISQSSPRDTQNYDLMPDQVVKEAKNSNCRSIAYTYSDPVAFYEYTLDTSMLARQQGIRNIIKSAGYINEDPLRRLLKYIDAGNIDLKSFDDSIYETLNAGTLEPVLRTLKIYKEMGVWLEITNLVVPTWTDDLDMIKKMCEWLVDNELQNYPLHFSRFSPVYKLTNLPQTPLATLEKARQIALQSGIKYSYIGNVPGSEGNNTYCPKCKKLLVERIGFSIKQNNIVASHCKFCSEKIDGVWD